MKNSSHTFTVAVRLPDCSLDLMLSSTVYPTSEQNNILSSYKNVTKLKPEFLVDKTHDFNFFFNAVLLTFTPLISVQLIDSAA